MLAVSPDPYHISNFFFVTHLLVFLIGSFFFAFGCGVDYEADFQRAIENENFAGAKRLLQEQIVSGFFIPQNNYGRAKVFYKLAYAHGMLAEYDSMKATLTICVSNDNNFAKAKRQMIEYFSLDEYNKAVFLYNGFFYDKAISKFKTAIDIVGTEAPYEEYSAVIFRCLAYAEASNKNLDSALNYCKEAARLGDALSKSILVEWEKEHKLKPPEQLEPREKPTLTI